MFKIPYIDSRPYDYHIGQWMTPNLEFIENSNSWSDVFQIHSYRFKQNDPFGQPTKHMDTFNDWLKLHLIKPPGEYFEDESIFSQIEIESNFDFVKKIRRPLLCNGFSSSTQLLGPKVILRYNDSTHEIQTNVSISNLNEIFFTFFAKVIILIFN